MTYPHFIELHFFDGFTTIVNIDRIVNVTIDKDNITVVMTTDLRFIKVKESYEEVIKLLEQVGVSITKRDPRMENKPVEWDTLTRVDMIGEPLYNSNSRRWMLLIDNAADKSWIELLDDCGASKRWTEHDVHAKPLYRMKEQI